jgi:hypothetical protein
VTNSVGTFGRIPGGQGLIDWFGAVPTFHDAEVLSLCLERKGTSTLVVYGFRMTAEIDARGYFVLDRKFIATFELIEIEMLELEGFSIQNVLDGLTLAESPSGYRIDLEPIYGLGGSIACKTVRVSFKPMEDVS